MFTPKNSSSTKNDHISYTEGKTINNLILEINRNYKNRLFFEIKKNNKFRSLVRNRSTFSPVHINWRKNSENSLTLQLKNKINKEALILELRQELKYHVQFNIIYKSLLTKTINLKEIVKENKLKIEENTNQLKESFKDKFDIIDNYEKTISLLQSEKQDLLKTNEEILRLREENHQKLVDQLAKIQDQNNEQRIKIEDLTRNITLLEYQKANLNDEMQSKYEKEEENYKKYLGLYKILAKKYEYYFDEYNSFCKSGNEMTQIDVKLSDDTNAKNSMKEENLQIELSEQIIRKENLMDNINILKRRLQMLKIKKSEEKIKDIKHYCKVGVGYMRKYIAPIRKSSSLKFFKKKIF